MTYKQLSWQSFSSLFLIMGLVYGVFHPVDAGTSQEQRIAQFNFGGETESEDNSCPTPVLSRLQRHTLTQGETLNSLARQYGLIPETLIRFNPILNNGAFPLGKEILIPPLNGMRVNVPQNVNWQDLSTQYGIRADVLFELNGCQRNPTEVFIPGVQWTSTATQETKDYLGLAGYPLPEPSSVGLSYGWYRNSESEENIFHSGLDLIAEPGTSVLSVDEGVVVFRGQQGNYGNLVVINHPQGHQTRYAHLETMTVSMGASVSKGDVLGTVGKTGIPDIDQPHLHFEVRNQSPLGWVAQDPEIHLQNN